MSLERHRPTRRVSGCSCPLCRGEGLPRSASRDPRVLDMFAGSADPDVAPAPEAGEDPAQGSLFDGGDDGDD